MRHICTERGDHEPQRQDFSPTVQHRWAVDRIGPDNEPTICEITKTAAMASGIFKLDDSETCELFDSLVEHFEADYCGVPGLDPVLSRQSFWTRLVKRFRRIK